MKDSAGGNNGSTRKAVLVTGCSSGIGRAAAVHLAGSGFFVFATVRKERDAEALRALGNDNLVPVCPLDLTVPEQIAGAAALVERTLAARGIDGLWGVVSNAGGGAVAPLELLDPRDLEAELNARIVGPLDLLQRLLPPLRRANGRIVWILTPGLFPVPFVGSIHAADFAATCVARTLGLELRSSGVRVLMVRCGAIQTESVPRSHTELEQNLIRWPHERLAIYRARLEENEVDLKKLDRSRTPVIAVAKTVQRALTALRPKRQYRVGSLVHLAGFLELLPSNWADWIMERR